MKVTPPIVLGFVVGVVLGMGDYLLLLAIPVSMQIGDRDVTLGVVCFFALNFGVLGAVIARLWEQRRDLRRQAEVIERQVEELRAAQTSLVESETLAAVGRMAAGVAHEVRNPLSVIRSSAQLIADSLEPDQEDAEAARFICDEVDRLDDFVHRVLDFSGRVDVRLEEVSWKHLRSRLASATDPGTDLGPEPTDADPCYRLDLDLTVRVLAALADNAHRIAAGGRVRIEPNGRSIDVVDDGPGVAVEHRESVFEPFFTTRADGSGLGLAMARKLARLQGWDLELGAGGLGPGGRGARFRLVPAAPAEQASPAGSAELAS